VPQSQPSPMCFSSTSRLSSTATTAFPMAPAPSHSVDAWPTRRSAASCLPPPSPVLSAASVPTAAAPSTDPLSEHILRMMLMQQQQRQQTNKSAASLSCPSVRELFMSLLSLSKKGMLTVALCRLLLQLRL
jgi:hypothetical protein